MNEFVANKALADELKKRVALVDKAHQQILAGNNGIAGEGAVQTIGDNHHREG